MLTWGNLAEMSRHFPFVMIEARTGLFCPAEIRNMQIRKQDRRGSKGSLMSKHKNRSEENGMPAFETNLFGDLMAFYRQIVARLPEESLDDEQQKLVLDRLNALIQTEIEDLEQTQDLNLSKRLEAVSEQIHQFIEELLESE